MRLQEVKRFEISFGMEVQVELPLGILCDGCAVLNDLDAVENGKKSLQVDISHATARS